MKMIFENVFPNDTDKIVFLLDGYDNLIKDEYNRNINILENFRLKIYLNC